MERKEFNELFTSIINNPEFQKLQNIGGELVYHREGNALMHTMMVVGAAKQMFGDTDEMVIVALLHDIGKIYTSVQKDDGWWCYPMHSVSGAENLHKFLPKDHPLYEKAKWYIYNHIKPMFFHLKLGDKRFFAEDYPNRPEGCTMSNLCKLVLCDFYGSNSTKDQEPEIEKIVNYYAESDL